MRRNHQEHGGSTNLAIAAICLIAPVGMLRVALASDNFLLGTWKLKSFVRQDVATGERRPALCEHPEAILATRPTAACTHFSSPEAA